MKYITLNLIKAVVVLSVFFTMAHAAPIVDELTGAGGTPTTTPPTPGATTKAPTTGNEGKKEDSHASAWSFEKGNM
ncbi:hypothetical protein BDF22DRAFT_742014 [Syncephalis plumigaleata]|nr:hypothetical protein BDF22DRAFT_742014 [Syncephalis plumigaleata]